ncbi:MAG TPA: hypothetical protein VKQ30_23370 [Ktedonobacterales bacterium]|nr:hypothetical protein [Ktedonobacterales bacterium]
MPSTRSTALANSTRLRLIAGFGLVVAMSAAVGVATHPLKIGSPVVPAESGSLTSATVPVLDLSAQARDDWRLTSANPPVLDPSAQARDDWRLSGASVPVVELSAQARDDWRLPRVVTDRHAVDRHEDVAQP